jgi:hypothetical protein
MYEHDVPMDYIVTRNDIIKSDISYVKPKRIDWNIIGDKIKEIPILQILKNRNKS